MYAIINIIGLAAASACMLFAVLYWHDEHNFDDFHTNNPNLFRITTHIVEKDGNTITTGGTGQVQGPAFKNLVPEVKEFVRVMGGDISGDLSSGNRSFRIKPLFVDDNFLNVFTFQLILGNPATALKDIYGIVITESTAKKYFNTINVIGKTLSMPSDPSFEKLGKPLTITGIAADPPRNSSLQFEVLFPFSFMNLSFQDENWLNAYLGTFVVLQPNADLQSVSSKFNNVYKVHAKEQLVNSDFNIYGYDPKITYGLQPISEIHLDPLMVTTGNAEGGIINGSNPVYSYLFMGIAVFILLMASINFINISIASSFRRAKEIGIRKITGGNRWQIILQIMQESAIICLIAFFVSIAIMNYLLPLFNSLSGKQLVFRDAMRGETLVYFFMVLLIIIFLSGIYPAHILSKFKPSEVLYNRQKLTGNSFFGKGLVVFQFSLAIFLLIATIVYYNQMNFIRTKNLGYNPNQIIRTSVYGDRDYKHIMHYLKNELAKEPSIEMVSFGNGGWAEDLQINNRVLKGHFKNIDENFLAAMEIPLKAGRNLSPAYGLDKTEGVLVNEAFVKAFKLSDPVGKKVMINRHYDSSFKTIRGVTKDFHFGSLREPIKPMVMYMSEVPGDGLWVKVKKSKQHQAITALKKIYMKTMPDAIFEYQYLDELNARQYFQEQRWQKVINVSTLLSLLICCLGLFGLSHLSAYQRIREIGIRKVLGASVTSMATLLSRDFIKLVLIACLLAFPFAAIVMTSWLNNYAYRVNMGWWIFLTAGFAAMLIAAITISFQAVKAALANPVNSLRTE